MFFSRMSQAFLSSDPYFANVSLLVHMDGLNGATSFPDVTGKAITPLNTTISTAQSKFSGSSGYFSGANSYLAVPDSAAFNLSGDFTLEFWMYPTSLAVRAGSWSDGLLSKRTNADTNYAPYAISLRSTGAVEAIFSLAGTTWNLSVVSTALATANKWNHIAVVRQGTTITVFVNGLGTSGTLSGALMVNTSPVYLGTTGSAGTTWFLPLHGYMCEARITKGVCRYPSNFSIPNSSFPNN